MISLIDQNLEVLCFELVSPIDPWHNDIYLPRYTKDWTKYSTVQLLV